ncbi:HEAT repeat domain-containing protein [Azospirillum endophyticum]
MPLVKKPTLPLAEPLPASELLPDGDLPARLAAPTASVRRTAVHALAEAGGDGDAGTLCGRLALETDESVREAIFLALAAIGGDAAVVGLLPLLSDEDPALRNGAIETLQQLPGPVAPHMEALLADPDSDVRIFAVNVAGNLRHPDVERWMLSVLRDDRHVNVVAAAIDTLAEVGTEAACADLEAVVHRFPGDAFLAFTQRTALRRIRGG